MIPRPRLATLALALLAPAAAARAQVALVQPDGDLGRLWEARAPGGSSAWPRPWRELCAGRDSVAPADALDARLREACREEAYPGPVRGAVAPGASTLDKRYPLGVPFEDYDPSGSWRSIRVDPDLAHAWLGAPPLARLDLQYPLDANLHAFLRLDLRRALPSWERDPLGRSLPEDGDQVNANQPTYGYLHYEDARVEATVGRFPVHWSPSPEYGVALSNSVPYHEGFLLGLRLGPLRYRFLYSSVNTWLQGTPDSAGNFPAGSEEWIQRHPPGGSDPNAHNRVYAERARTLLAHRLEAAGGRWEAGLTEMQMVGGKLPDFHDANPFAIWHQDFTEGYINMAVSADGKVRLGHGFSLLAEMYFDDIFYPGSEQRDNSATIKAWMWGVEHACALGGIAVRQSLHWIETDPFAYNARTPYASLHVRQILTGNDQAAWTDSYVDKHVIDYPVGYFRGSDALDLWYGLQAWAGPWTLGLRAGWLLRGDRDAYAPYSDSLANILATPSGVVERDLKADFTADRRLPHGLDAGAGAGVDAFRNLGNRAGKRRTDARAALFLRWTFPPG